MSQGHNFIEKTWRQCAWHEWKVQIRTAIPSMVGMVVNRIPWIISICFAGKIGSEQLAVIALSTTLCKEHIDMIVMHFVHTLIPVQFQISY